MTFNEWAERWYNNNNLDEFSSYSNEQQKRITQNLFKLLTNKINLLFSICCTNKNMYYNMYTNYVDEDENETEYFDQKKTNLTNRIKKLKSELSNKQKDYKESLHRNSPLLDRKIIKINNLIKKIKKLEYEYYYFSITYTYRKDLRFQCITNVEADFYDLLMEIIVKCDENNNNVYTMFYNNKLEMMSQEKREILCNKIIEFYSQKEINWEDLQYKSLHQAYIKLKYPIYYRIHSNLDEINSFINQLRYEENIDDEYKKLVSEIDKKSQKIIQNIKNYRNNLTDNTTLLEKMYNIISENQENVKDN